MMYDDVIMKMAVYSHFGLSKEVFLLGIFNYYTSIIARNLYYWEA